MGLLAALGVRLAWAVIYPAKPVSDFHWYYEVGREIAQMLRERAARKIAIGVPQPVQE